MADDGVNNTLTASASAGAATSTAVASEDADTSPSPADTSPGPSPEDVVRSLFDAFSRRALSETLALLHPEVVFQPMTAEVTQAGEPYCGHEGIRRYATDVETQWSELTLRPTQIRAAGQAVVALGQVSGSGRAGSFEDAPTTWVFKFKEGLIVHAQIFSEARHVFEALGSEA